MSMLTAMVKCNLCNKIIDVEETNKYGCNILEEHMLSHIPPVDLFDLFNNVGDQCLDVKFPKEKIEKIVDDLYWYDDFDSFDNLRNDDEWPSEIMTLSWEVLDEWFKEIDKELVGQDLTIDYTKIRTAMSKIVHRYVTDITKAHLFTAINGILNNLDWWKCQLTKQVAGKRKEG